MSKSWLVGWDIIELPALGLTRHYCPASTRWDADCDDDKGIPSATSHCVFNRLGELWDWDWGDQWGLGVWGGDVYDGEQRICASVSGETGGTDGCATRLLACRLRFPLLVANGLLVALPVLLLVWHGVRSAWNRTHRLAHVRRLQRVWEERVGELRQGVGGGPVREHRQHSTSGFAENYVE